MESKKRIGENPCAVNVKSRKILSMKVTDEHVHDGKALPELVGICVKPNNTTAAVGKLFADGACDGNDIFRYFASKWNPALYRTKKYTRVRLKTGHILRNL